MIATGAICASLTSCNSDYLDKEPVTSNTAYLIATTIEGARGAKNGMLAGMYRQLSADAFNLWQQNGELSLSYFYGELGGSSLLSHACTVTLTGWADWTQYRDESQWGAVFMWYYAYNLINWANLILENIDNLDAFDGERDYIKATALAMRAHCYTRLVQVYAPNWENSNNGDIKCIVMRTSSSTEYKEFGTMNEALDLIYSDLNEAISLFDSCGWKRTFIWEMNGNIARGLLARAAAIKHDYQLAEQMAREARAGYPIMSAEEYLQGFIVANNEYLWANVFEPSFNKYYTYGSYNACNSQYQETWQVTCVNAIDYTLYHKFPNTDIRKKLYLTPEMIELNPELSQKYGVKASDFFDSSLCDNSNGYDIRTNNYNPAMQSFILEYGQEEFNRHSQSYTFDEDTFVPYQRTGAQIPFGAQYKFWGDTEYATDQIAFMRAAELAYLEAEMAYRNGNETRAREIMNELNKDIRDPNYNCTATGEALLQEIKDYRTFELWGEGFNWFDLKRWHDPIVRTAWEPGNPESGNRGSNYLQYIGPDEYYGWVVCVPNGEFNTNKLARRDDLPGSNR